MNHSFEYTMTKSDVKFNGKPIFSYRIRLKTHYNNTFVMQLMRQWTNDDKVIKYFQYCQCYID